MNPRARSKSGTLFHLFHHGTPPRLNGESVEIYTSVSVDMDTAKDLLLAAFAMIWDVDLSEVEIYSEQEMKKAPRCKACSLVTHPPNDECLGQV